VDALSGGREVRIALPGLADSLARLSAEHATLRLPAAEWVMARGRENSSVAQDWRAWVLAGAGVGDGVLDLFPAGPSSVPADFVARAGQAWARAEPVHLLTAIDHLQLSSPVPLTLEASESGPLLETLNAHLAGTGFELRALADGGWLCRCPEGLECETVDPLDALGRNLRDVLPSGRDAVRVRSLVNELQMLLHEHPVNDRRAARGLPPVNSVWLWGIGAEREPTADVKGGDLLTDDAWLAALWRRHGGRIRSVAELGHALEEGGADLRVATVAAREGRPAADVLQALETSVFAPVRAALAASRVSRVSLYAGGRVIDLTPSARWAFWRRARPLAEVLK
jgi:hypothetical protein